MAVTYPDWLQAIRDKAAAGEDIAFGPELFPPDSLAAKAATRQLFYITDGAAITVTTSRQGDRFDIFIEDNGPGISNEDLPRVFEPLFSTKSFGTGLGMSVVRQTLEQHGGAAAIRSDPGKGTRVLLWLPAPAGAA